ncbi:uncharacterized protein SPPG_09042 [Spizellomyces punctatus DAOM BR117]|uniref:protein-tyrosine-phosphatase n=1 Tax=Spizellomyces punctatus (strain DAOM BR117) TaxID=645134 RepID=A0A0L0HMI4_SPIPD|nr:uncharacterized protein SPPG_09042 [Spizellomyces punctatus DAOM BR117]KND02115.1 hypothetical protein SPPG_09042 [Spizellomyces punctatus DAOM BR117]|eukprot:XP_016610154.1 hypothetical protein SPPG_09042 [Spizellomyces punctatus DAOM BR117]
MPYSTTGLIHHASSTSPADLLANAREFIKDKLYFTWLSQHPAQYPSVHFFTIDHVLVYINFYSDFGPSNLAHVVRFCDLIVEKMKNPRTADKKLVLYSSHDSDKRANAAFLICAYMLIVHRQTPEEAFRPLLGIQPPFLPYRDAGYGAATYHITIPDCLRGLHKGLTLGLLDLDSVDVEEYEFYEKVENGDFNWITNKFIALASPKDDPAPRTSSGFQQHHAALRTGTGWASGFAGLLARNNAVAPQRAAKPSKFHPAYRIDDLIKYLKERGVTTIIRLNNRTYDRTKFVQAGIEHVELYFPDGTTPPDGVLMRFLEICENRPGSIAVHCKAGLGRTGTLIAAYLMKHYKFTASEVISFLRIVRPGSVVGPQQNYLQSMQAKLWKLHPSGTLPPQISLLKPPTYPSLRRWPKPSIEPPSNTVTDQVEDDVQEELETEAVRLDEERGEIEKALREAGRMRGTAGEKLEEMAIPLQPRKHIGREDEKDREKEVRSQVQAARELALKQTENQRRTSPTHVSQTKPLYNYTTTTTTPISAVTASSRTHTPRSIPEKEREKDSRSAKSPPVKDFVVVGRSQTPVRGVRNNGWEKEGGR